MTTSLDVLVGVESGVRVELTSVDSQESYKTQDVANMILALVDVFTIGGISAFQERVLKLDRDSPELGTVILEWRTSPVAYPAIYRTDVDRSMSIRSVTLNSPLRVVLEFITYAGFSAVSLNGAIYGAIALLEKVRALKVQRNAAIYQRDVLALMMRELSMIDVLTDKELERLPERSRNALRIADVKAAADLLLKTEDISLLDPKSK